MELERVTSIEPQAMKSLAALSPAELITESEAVSSRLQALTKGLVDTVWHEAAPLIDRVQSGGRPLLEKMGFLGYDQYREKYWSYWGPRTIQLWLDVHRTCPFLTPAEKVDWPFFRLAILARIVRDNPKLIDEEGHPTPELQILMEKVRDMPVSDLQPFVHSLRLGAVPETEFQELNLWLDSDAIQQWRECKESIARHSGKPLDTISDNQAMGLVTRSFLDEIDQEDRVVLHEAGEWAQKNLKE